jgi:hypothetical protein
VALAVGGPRLPVTVCALMAGFPYGRIHDDG